MESMKDDLLKNGFVFLDASGRPYYFGDYEGSKWLFYWHPDNHWVMHRKVKDGESFHDDMHPDQQALYHEEHDKYLAR